MLGTIGGLAIKAAGVVGIGTKSAAGRLGGRKRKAVIVIEISCAGARMT
jgi:hypothetical protein